MPPDFLENSTLWAEISLLDGVVLGERLPKMSRAAAHDYWCKTAQVHHQVVPLGWLLPLTKSFAWLASRVVGLFYTPQQKQGVNKLSTWLASHANNFVNAESHAREKTLLTGQGNHQVHHQVVPLGWLLPLTKSFAWLASRVVGLFYTPQQKQGVNKLSTWLASHANNFVNAESHAREKTLLTGQGNPYFLGWSSYRPFLSSLFLQLLPPLMVISTNCDSDKSRHLSSRQWADSCNEIGVIVAYSLRDTCNYELSVNPKLMFFINLYV